MRVGIVGYLRTRGLAFDGEAIRAALAGRGDVELSVFPVEDLHVADRAFRKGRVTPAAPAPGWEWPEAVRGVELGPWLDTLDVLVTLEVFLRRIAARAREGGARHVHIPNLEWVSDREGWRDELASADVLVAKTRHTRAWLADHGLERVRLVPWSVPLPPEPPRPTRPPVRFLHLSGEGGSSDAKNPGAALEAFADRLAGRSDARLTVLAQRPFARRKARVDVRPFRRVPNVEVREGEATRAEVLDLYRSADVAVFPSRVEGFGLPLLESLTLGVPVVTTDGPPMNELVSDGENGLLVPARESGRHRHVPLLEVDREALAAALERLADDPALVDRLKAGTGAGLAARREAFVAGIREAIGGSP